jgi:hypothetical protein
MQGVDIYAILTDNSISFKKTIVAKDFNLNTIDIRSVKIDPVR